MIGALMVFLIEDTFAIMLMATEQIFVLVSMLKIHDIMINIF